MTQIATPRLRGTGVGLRDGRNQGPRGISTPSIFPVSVSLGSLKPHRHSWGAFRGPWPESSTRKVFFLPRTPPFRVSQILKHHHHFALRNSLRFPDKNANTPKWGVGQEGQQEIPAGDHDSVTEMERKGVNLTVRRKTGVQTLLPDLQAAGTGSGVSQCRGGGPRPSPGPSKNQRATGTGVQADRAEP